MLFINPVSGGEIVTHPEPTLIDAYVEPESGPVGTVFRITAEFYDVSGVLFANAKIIKDGSLVSTLNMSNKENEIWSVDWDSFDKTGGVYKVSFTACDTLHNCGDYDEVRGFTINLCSDGTEANQCSTTKPKYCTSEFIFVDDCSLCGCPSGYVCTDDGSCSGTCSDGTVSGECSTTKPKYCDNGNLIDACSVCGCPPGNYGCLSKGSCIVLCEDGTVSGECSTTKPKYCDNGNLIDACSVCGCPPGESCTNNICHVSCKDLSETQCISSAYCEPENERIFFWSKYSGCIDATCNDGKQNQGEEDIDCGGPCPECVYCTDGTLNGQCSITKPKKKCIEGKLVDDCSLCGCPSGEMCDKGTCVPAHCSDGTLYSSCSSDKPKYCTSYGTLINNCKTCGCPSGYYCADNGINCLKATCYDGKKNGDEEGIDCGGSCPSGCSNCLESEKPSLVSRIWNGVIRFFRRIFRGSGDWPFYVGHPIVKKTAQDALREYANYKGISVRELNTADEYMEAVAYYVDKHTQYTRDERKCKKKCILWGLICWKKCDKKWDGTQSSIQMITESGSRGCGKDYCGDCEDHAVLRTALLRTLGVSWECVWNADWFGKKNGHEYNIVNYKNKYRIMDYGPLGAWFTQRWYAHRTNNVYNDKVGSALPSKRPAKYTYNYPQSSSKCPKGGWTYETVYEDVCP